MRGQREAFFVLCLCLGMSAVVIPSARSTWVADGVALSPDASNYEPFIISDGASGTIIAWHGGAASDIFARRLLGDGASAPGWPVTAPLVVCGATGLQADKDRVKIVGKATTDASGKFTMQNIPAGLYRLEAGNKNMGWIYQDVNIEADKTVELNDLKLAKID